MSAQPDIIYTKVDEAPELASGSFLPIIQSFAKTAGVNVGTKDISLAGRIIAQFPDVLKPEQRQSDDLALLGEIVMTPESNVIKLPNISASLPQIKGAIKELQSQGYACQRHHAGQLPTSQHSYFLDGVRHRAGCQDSIEGSASASTASRRSSRKDFKAARTRLS